MNRDNYEGMCKVSALGKIKYVDNQMNHQTGRVIACSMDQIEVEIEGHHETWKRQDCEERTYGYKPVYQ